MGDNTGHFADHNTSPIAQCPRDGPDRVSVIFRDQTNGGFRSPGTWGDLLSRQGLLHPKLDINCGTLLALHTEGAVTLTKPFIKILNEGLS